MSRISSADFGKIFNGRTRGGGGPPMTKLDRGRRGGPSRVQPRQ
jgi:hypothetical protein